MRTYHPVLKTDGTAAGILGCDYNVSFIDKQKKAVIFWIAASCLLAALITFLLSYSLAKQINSAIGEQRKASDIKSGTIELCNDNYAVKTLFDNVSTLFSLQAQPRNLDFKSSFDINLPTMLYGDEKRVGQICTNLLSNAVKFTKAGGAVNFRFEKSKADFRDAELIIRVSDTGAGIKPELKHTLFSFAEQADSGIGAGGIGLAITKRLVELMGGGIDFESHYGSGTVFTVRLPLVMGNAGEVKAKKEFVRAKDGAVTALIADDTQMNLSVLKGMLNKHNIKVDTAINGQDALERLKNNTYDIVFLDYLMPVMDGLEAARQIRALATEQSTVPIIAVSAKNAQNACEIFLNAGMNDFLHKPVDTEKLNTILHTYLSPDKIETRSETSGIGHEGGDTSVINETDASGADIYKKLLTIDGFDAAAGLRNTGGQKSEYFDILKDFCGELDEFVKIIRDDFGKKDWQDYRIRMHGLKGSFATIGQKNLSEMSRRLEWGGKIAGGGASDAEFSWSRAEAEKICEDETEAVLNACLDFSATLRLCGL
jgi:CheY-like chemotaxis protein